MRAARSAAASTPAPSSRPSACSPGRAGAAAPESRPPAGGRPCGRRGGVELIAHLGDADLAHGGLYEQAGAGVALVLGERAKAAEEGGGGDRLAEARAPGVEGDAA